MITFPITLMSDSSTVFYEFNYTDGKSFETLITEGWSQTTHAPASFIMSGNKPEITLDYPGTGTDPSYGTISFTSDGLDGRSFSTYVAFQTSGGNNCVFEIKDGNDIVIFSSEGEDYKEETVTGTITGDSINYYLYGEDYVGNIDQSGFNVHSLTID